MKFISENPSILFIATQNEFDFDPGFRPLGIGYLMAAIRKKCACRCDCRVIKTADEMTSGNFDVLLISSITSSFCYVKEIASKAKKQNPDCIVIAGGQHLTQMPNMLPPDVDYGLRGEGEESLPQLLNAIFSDSIADIPLVPGIIMRQQDGTLFFSDPARVDISNVEMPDRTFSNGKDTMPYLLTSRGCPFACTFCSSASWRKISHTPINLLCDEIEKLATDFPNIITLSIWDDLFAVSPKRLRELADALQARGLLGRFRFSCSARADILTSEICDLLKALNVFSCYVGFESGNDRILHLLKPQGSLSVKKNYEALELLHRYQFEVGMSCVVGVPTETRSELMDTLNACLRLVRERKCQNAVVNILVPFPGTYYWDFAVKKNIINLQKPEEFLHPAKFLYSDPKYTSFKDFDTWRSAREKNHSFYLNEEFVPQQELLDILDAFYAKRELLMLEAKLDATPDWETMYKQVVNSRQWRYTTPLKKIYNCFRFGKKQGAENVL